MINGLSKSMRFSDSYCPRLVLSSPATTRGMRHDVSVPVLPRIPQFYCAASSLIPPHFSRRSLQPLSFLAPNHCSLQHRLLLHTHNILIIRIFPLIFAMKAIQALRITQTKPFFSAFFGASYPKANLGFCASSSLQLLFP